MKQILLLLLVLFKINFVFASFEEREKPKLVPVSQVQVKTLTGCGAPNEDGLPCNLPDQTAVSFVVEWGGSCHEYSAEVVKKGSHQILKIWDVEMSRCTRPEHSNYTTSLPLKGLEAGVPMKLQNSLYVETLFRP